LALPTAAHWADQLKRLEIVPGIGLQYLSYAPIYAAIGLPLEMNETRLKVNWSDGATADHVSVTTYGSGAAAGHVDDTITSSYGMIAGTAHSDIIIENHGDELEALGQSFELAYESIYKQWCTDLFSGANSGTQVHGLDAFLVLAQATPVSTDTQLTSTEANILKNLVSLKIRLALGPKIVLCSETGYSMVDSAISAAGGITPGHQALEYFGEEYLTYRGMYFFHCDLISAVEGDEVFYMISKGPKGVKLCVPRSKGMWQIPDPVRTAGVFATTFDVALVTQLLYNSPRAAGTLTVTPTPAS